MPTLRAASVRSSQQHSVPEPSGGASMHSLALPAEVAGCCSFSLPSKATTGSTGLGVGGDRDPGTDPGSDLIAFTASRCMLSEGFPLLHHFRCLTSRGLISQGICLVFHPRCHSGHPDVPPTTIWAIALSGRQPPTWVLASEKSSQAGTSSSKPSLQQPGALCPPWTPGAINQPSLLLLC